MAIGTLLAAFPGSRRRRAIDPVSAPVAEPERMAAPDPRSHRRHADPTRTSTVKRCRCDRVRQRRPTWTTVGGDAAPGRRRRRVAPWIVLAVSVVLAGLFVVLAGAKSEHGESSGSALLGRPAPEATGTLDDGSSFDLSRRKGSWVVLNFFDPDCIPCQQEHRELVAVRRQPGGARQRRRGVVLGDHAGHAREGRRLLRRAWWRLAADLLEGRRVPGRLRCRRRCPRRGSSIRAASCSSG